MIKLSGFLFLPEDDYDMEICANSPQSDLNLVNAIYSRVSLPLCILFPEKDVY